MRSTRLPSLVLLAIVLSSVGAAARAESGREILDRMKQLDETSRRWDDRTQQMTIRMIGKGGDERSRKMLVFTRRSPDGGEKSISFFLEPADVRGTGFLQWMHTGRDDEQWAYFPEMRRVRAITGNLRDNSFVGDFTYRDLRIVSELHKWPEQEAPSALLGTETIAGKECRLIEVRPTEDMPYGKLVLAIDAELVPCRLDFHGRDGELAKRLSVEEIRTVGAIPTASRVQLEDVRKGSRTRIELGELRYDSGLSDDVFTQRSLERGPP